MRPQPGRRLFSRKEETATPGTRLVRTLIHCPVPMSRIPYNPYITHLMMSLDPGSCWDAQLSASGCATPPDCALCRGQTLAVQGSDLASVGLRNTAWLAFGDVGTRLRHVWLCRRCLIGVQDQWLQNQVPTVTTWRSRACFCKHLTSKNSQNSVLLRAGLPAACSGPRAVKGSTQLSPLNSSSGRRPQVRLGIPRLKVCERSGTTPGA